MGRGGWPGVRRELAVARVEIRQGRFQRTMALLSAFSAIVSGFEAYTQHERGAFSHWLMWTPVWLTPPATLAGIAAVFSRRVARLVLPVVALASLIDGLLGFIYHIRGVRGLPGGFRLGQYNLVIGPPLFAPVLTGMVGVLGLLASALRREQLGWFESRSPSLGQLQRLGRFDTRQASLPALLAHGEFQRGMALLAAVFAALAGGEAYLEHLRGSFNRRVMWTPVWVTPPMIAAGIAAALDRRAARLVLPFVSLAALADGALGFVLHVQGLQRMPGGVRNLRFNLVLGPPLFAPLLFSAVGLLGLIATLLRRRDGA
ncbi:MAG TPA: hypothetical protein VFU72_01605 [Nitrolancea sp.]|nr:hypothetical protein [Nitrolancea sp.]